MFNLFLFVWFGVRLLACLLVTCLSFFWLAFSFVFLVSFVLVLSLTTICLHAKLRIYKAMGGKIHDMSFCVEVGIRQWNSSTANKTYPQDFGTGRC